MSKIKKVSRKELELLSHRDCVRFAVFCVEQVKDNWKDIPECVSAIEVANRWLEGRATAEECEIAARFTYATTSVDYGTHTNNRSHSTTYATTYAAVYATNSICNTANSASDAAYAVHCVVAENPWLAQAQWEYYLELLHFDDIAEKALLGEIV